MPQGVSEAGDVVDGEVVLTSLGVACPPASFSQWRPAIKPAAEFGPASQSLLDQMSPLGSLAERHMFARLTRSNLESGGVRVAIKPHHLKPFDRRRRNNTSTALTSLSTTDSSHTSHNGRKPGPQTRLHWAHTILQCSTSAAQPTETSRHSRHWTLWWTVHERELCIKAGARAAAQHRGRPGARDAH